MMQKARAAARAFCCLRLVAQISATPLLYDPWVAHDNWIVILADYGVFESCFALTSECGTATSRLRSVRGKLASSGRMASKSCSRERYPPNIQTSSARFRPRGFRPHRHRNSRVLQVAGTNESSNSRKGDLSAEPIGQPLSDLVNVWQGSKASQATKTRYERGATQNL